MVSKIDTFIESCNFLHWHIQYYIFKIQIKRWWKQKYEMKKYKYVLVPMLSLFHEFLNFFEIIWKINYLKICNFFWKYNFT
jgi:hypothetical protein